MVSKEKTPLFVLRRDKHNPLLVSSWNKKIPTLLLSIISLSETGGIFYWLETIEVYIVLLLSCIRNLASDAR